MRNSVRRQIAPKGGATGLFPSRIYSERVVTGIVCTILVGIVWIVFGQTLRHEFVNYDDDQYVYENARITNGLTLEGIQWAFTHVHADNWHPLTTISHMLDCQLYGLEPWGHHLTNVMLHAAATVFLFLALWQLTGARWPSAFVAAVFAIHPLRVASVAWVAERKDVLSGVFFMLTLWAYARYARSSRPSSGRYTLALVLFALGLMCKPTLVTLPFVLLLLDYWPLRRFTGNKPTRGGPASAKPVRYLLVEKIPFFVLSAASCVATLLAQERAVITLRQLTFGDRLANAVVSYVAYLGQMIWPAGLAVVYPFPQGGWNIIQTILALLVLLLISVVFFTWRVKYPFLLVGWLWFLGMLVPMIGIVQVGVQARADRYTYLAQIGLYLLVTWGAMELFARWRRGREVLIAIAGLVVTGLMADSYFQTSFWRDSETLWNQTLANTSNNYIAHNNLGKAVMQKGRLDEAVVHFRKALEICVNCPEVHNNLGHVLARKGDWSDAITSYRAAMQAWPRPDAHNNNNLGISLAKVGKTDEALAQFREALRIDGNYREAHCNLAILLLQLGQRDEAIVHLREALRLKPDDEQVKAQLRQLGVEE
jgi:protein O-mannosyl-transferase